MVDVLEECIEEIRVNDCTAFHVLLGGLSEEDTLDLMDVLYEKMDKISHNFVTVYNYEGFMVTPKSKTKAKQLIKYVDGTGRSRGTIAYGADYFVRLVGSIIRPSTVFVVSKQQAFEQMRLKCS